MIVAGIVAGALVLGVVGTTTGMIWALNENDRANDEKTKATRAAESEAKARKRAGAISEFVTTALQAGDAESTDAKEEAADAGYDMTILAAMDNAIRTIDSGLFKDDPETEAELRNTIAVILHNNGQYDRARLLQEQVLATRERFHKSDDLIVADSLFNLAEVYRAQSQYVEAEPLYLRALATSETALGPDHPDMAMSLNSLAALYEVQGHYAQAEPLIREAGAHDDWATFNARSLLGGALLGQNRLAEAEPMLLDGYRGMQEREAAIPAVVEARIPEALERLVRL